MEENSNSRSGGEGGDGHLPIIYKLCSKMLIFLKLFSKMLVFLKLNFNKIELCVKLDIFKIELYVFLSGTQY